MLLIVVLRQPKEYFSSSLLLLPLKRVFSLLRNSFGAQQDNALKDYIEASLMLQFNKC